MGGGARTGDGDQLGEVITSVQLQLYIYICSLVINYSVQIAVETDRSQHVQGN